MSGNLHRLRLIALQTLGEALRLRLAVLLAVAAASLVAGSHWLRDFNFGATEIAFLADLGAGGIGLTGTLLAVLAMAHLFFSDLEGAAACILTRPVRCWEHVVGKLAGVAGLLALFTALLGGLLATMIWWRARELGVPPVALPVFLHACALQWMKFTLVAAMTLVVCAYAGSALFASCAGLMLALIGHLRPFATGAMEWLRVWPNLALFDAAGVLAGGIPDGSQLPGIVAYWASCVGVLAVLASWVFKQREF